MNKYRVELTAIVEAETANEAIAKLLEDLEQYDILVKAYKLSDKARKGRVKTNQGHFKDFIINLPLIITDKITFYCCADKKELERLLPHLSHIGKKTSIGGGRIRNINIYDEEEDYSFFKDGELMRTIPVSLKIPLFEGVSIQRQPYKPPYWDKKNVEMCYTPQPQIKGN